MTPEEWAGIVERDDASLRSGGSTQPIRDRRALIALVEEMREALDFHNKTPSGATRSCLSGCVACVLLSTFPPKP